MCFQVSAIVLRPQVLRIVFETFYHTQLSKILRC